MSTNSVYTFPLAQIRDIPMEQILESLGRRRVGKRFECHAHDDKHPSANVRKNRLFCFVCDRSLDAIDLVMAVHGCDFKTAVHNLADSHGIPIVHHTLTTGERREFACRRDDAEREGRTLKWWRDGLIELKRQELDFLIPIIRNAIPWALKNIADPAKDSDWRWDYCWFVIAKYEPRVEQLYKEIDLLKNASFRELLPLYRQYQQLQGAA
jgi:hypothetical protein